MAAVEQNEDLKSGLRSLVPLSALSDEKFAELAAGTRIEEVNPGDKLFVEGDKDARAVYILAGKVAMMSGKSVVDTVLGGTEDARYPLAHHLPRQLTAVAKNAVSYVCIDTHLLDNLLNTGRQQRQDSYEVSEVLEEEDSDWMSQMLQSETFAHLPAENIQALFMRMEEVAVNTGDTILKQGDRADYFYMLRRGRCTVEVEQNNQSRVVAELNAGDTFGEEALIAETLRNASVTMLTDGVLMRLSKNDFDSLMKQPLINWVTFDEAKDIVNNGGVWLDVRAPNEFRQSRIAASHNFPLSILMSNAERLKTTRNYVTYCDTGKRSSVAAFLLRQRG
ncbi:MAG: cyclic nucleotide-binding domain-containing protein, partial [Halobacteria archaeon]|nr:cyclic nucleotide-binding domain-containing protein [Halobacteria archaeon]